MLTCDITAGLYPPLERHGDVFASSSQAPNETLYPFDPRLPLLGSFDSRNHLVCWTWDVPLLESKSLL